MRIQRVPSKWAKTKVILQNQSLAFYIPDTRKYNFEALKEMLGLYRAVYIKPDRGTYGIGVMRAEQRIIPLPANSQQDNGAAENQGSKEEKVMYILRYNKAAEMFSSPEEMHNHLLSRIQGRLYLIQKGIDLLKHHNLPFDLRVLTQKKTSGAWETTGMLGRVAAPQKIVTNYHNGGSILSVKRLFKDHMNPSETATAMGQLKLLGIQIASQLQTAYPGIKEIGLDVAMDHHHAMWLLEVNTLPSIAIFKKFPDKSIYRRIHKYAVAYGRVKKNKSTVSSRRKRVLKRRK